MKAEWRLFILAVTLLTRWAPGGAGAGQAGPGWGSLRHFPGVGLLIGSVSAASLWAAGHAWPALLSVLVSMATAMWLTRARHELGLARCLAQQAPPEPPGREGPASALSAPGLLALVMMLALKATALYSLVVRDLGVALATMALAHAWSRAAMVLPVMVQRQRRAQAEAGLASDTDGLALPWALLWCVVAGAASTVVMPGAALVVAALACALMLVVALQQLRLQPGAGGSAGMDAVQQLCELAVYLAVVAVMAQG